MLDMYRTCFCCDFYQSSPPGEINENGQGECRFNPPVPRLTYDGRHDDLEMGVWPRVRARGWCAKWRNA